LLHRAPAGTSPSLRRLVLLRVRQLPYYSGWRGGVPYWTAFSIVRAGRCHHAGHRLEIWLGHDGWIGGAVAGLVAVSCLAERSPWRVCHWCKPPRTRCYVPPACAKTTLTASAAFAFTVPTLPHHATCLPAVLASGRTTTRLLPRLPTCSIPCGAHYAHGMPGILLFMFYEPDDVTFE